MAAIIGGDRLVQPRTRLAQNSRKVVLIEKKVPGYHVGESLMPYCYFTLERLGLVEELMASDVPKYSVQFASQDGKISEPFYFLTLASFLHHWQVWRSDFDNLILGRAREKAHLFGRN